MSDSENAKSANPLPAGGLPAFLVERAERNRREMVHGLKATADVVEAIRGWRAGDLYSASGNPEVILNLKQNSDGSVMGFAHGSDGRFIGHARWTMATTWGARVISSASILAGHAMLVEISQKLDRIEAKVDRIKQALDDDRRQELKGAIDSVQSALLVRESEIGRGLLMAAAAPLQIAIRKELQALKRAIARAPMPPRSHAEGFVWDKAPQTREGLLSAESSFLAALQGIRTITHLYIALGEDTVAWESTHRLLTQLSEAELDDAWWKARNLRPTDCNDQPEAFWTRAMAIAVEGRTQALAFAQDAVPSLRLSLRPSEVNLVVGSLDTDKVPVSLSVT